jgi:CRISPR-associated exonuclease Cas4
MIIEKIEISNWRSIVSETILFQDLMIFIGQNNHGKSNVLSSILFFFGHITLENQDFHRGSSDLYVEITFDKLYPSEQQKFAKYVTSENKIRVRKTGSKDTGIAYHGYTETPNDVWLREDNAPNYTSRDAVNQTPLSGLVPAAGRLSKEIITNAQRAYIQANAANLQFSYELESSSFMGFKNVAKGSFGDLYFIPSIKSASEELNVKGNTLFNQLYSRVLNRMSESNREYKEAKQKIEELTKILNKNIESGEENTNRPQEITNLEAMIETELSAWNTKIDVEITTPNIDEIFRVGANVWVDDGIRTDINRKGHGLQRALIFALIKSWAKILQDERRQPVEAAALDDEVIEEEASSCYFIFEEPELFLHPQAQRELFASLLELSRSDGQVILCTHSSAFIDLNNYKSICIVKKTNIELGSKALQCTDDLFSNSTEKEEFNLVHWINPDRSELFFATKVILVEGPSEKTVIPMLAKDIDVFRHDYTLIECGGKTVQPAYIKLLNKFGINYVCVYDRDHQSGKAVDAISIADRDTNAIESVIDHAIGKSVVLENDIEEELGLDASSKNKPYIAIKQIKADGFILSEQLKSKIEVMYE